MSKLKICVIVIEFLLFILPSLVLLWTGIFGVVYSEFVTGSCVSLFLLGIFSILPTMLEME